MVDCGEFCESIWQSSISKSNLAIPKSPNLQTVAKSVDRSIGNFTCPCTLPPVLKGQKVVVVMPAYNAERTIEKDVA